jgi:hypothetical protein
MDEATRTALEESIAHWRDIVDGWSDDMSAGACALCRKFRTQASCGACPVALKVSADYCANTPYAEVNFYKVLMLGAPSPGNEKAFRAAAQKELEFLESLRDPDEALRAP